jgi:hypothetical protein
VLDGQNEADETVKLELSGPNDGTTLGSQKTATLTITNSAPQAACTPRPKVQTQVIAGGSRLQVRIEATPLNSQQNNAIQQLVFGSFHNARVTLNGQLVGEQQTINLPPGLTTVELFVERAVAGEPTTVPFSVIDSCGEWKTFVGGGAGAGF